MFTDIFTQNQKKKKNKKKYSKNYKFIVFMITSWYYGIINENLRLPYKKSNKFQFLIVSSLHSEEV